MRLKAIVVVVSFILCLSMVPMLLPPTVTPVDADVSIATLNLTSNAFEPGNWRPLTLAAGDEVIQFTRANIVIPAGESASGTVSFGRWWGTTSGLFTGNFTIEFTQFEATWPALPSGTGQGYGVGKVTCCDGHGDCLYGVAVWDLDYASSGAVRTYTCPIYFQSTGGTGVFANERLVGNGTVNVVDSGVPVATATLTLRVYALNELVLGNISATGTVTSGNLIPLGSGSGPRPYDEFVQVSRPNLQITPPNQPANYWECGVGTVNGIGPFYQGNLALDWNEIEIPGTYLPYQGLAVGKLKTTDVSGTADLVFAEDYYGTDLSGNGSGAGYSFPTSATGQYAGKDGFGSYTYSITSAGNYVVTGTMLLSGPAAVAVATGVGAAIFDPPPGLSVERLRAISESALSTTGKPSLLFPAGFFEFNIPVTNPGEVVVLEIRLPVAVPTNAEYWKWNSTSGWYQIPFGSNDGDNVITITLQDGGVGDDDGASNGVINDQGGPGWPGGGGGVPVFPSIYIGIAAAAGAGMVAYLLTRRLAAR